MKKQVEFPRLIMPIPRHVPHADLLPFSFRSHADPLPIPFLAPADPMPDPMPIPFRSLNFVTAKCVRLHRERNGIGMGWERERMGLRWGSAWDRHGNGWGCEGERNGIGMGSAFPPRDYLNRESCPTAHTITQSSLGVSL